MSKWWDGRLLACGVTAATLVLFPLVNALTVAHGYWLHWRTQDTLETLGVWALIGGLAFVTIGVPQALGRPRVAEAVNAGWLLVGGYFAMGGLVKTTGLRDFALANRASAPWIAAAGLAVFGALAAKAWTRFGQRGARPLRRLTLTLSPLVIVFLLQLGTAQWHHLEPPRKDGRSATVGAAGSEATPDRSVRTLVLLFDELSRDHLYGDQAASLLELPSLRRFVGESKVYGGAYLPGGETRIAIPALFGRNGLGGDEALAADAPLPAGAPVPSVGGWVNQATRRGLDVRVFGWHVDYCVGIAAAATECRTVSLYNRRTVGSGFSLLHPLLTTLCLLPADPPFGWAKNAAARRMHLDTYALAQSWMTRTLAETRADIVYVHVNVPHVPFLDGALIGRELFVSTPARYVRQLHYVDAFLQSALQTIARAGPDGRPVRVIVMSDHNVRRLTPHAAHERVAFMVREPDGSAGPRNDSRVPASRLLADYLFH